MEVVGRLFSAIPDPGPETTVQKLKAHGLVPSLHQIFFYGHAKQ